MLYKDFKNIVDLLKRAVRVQDRCKDILQPNLFDEHNQLITELLLQLYNKYAVTYVLNEWLCGNKNPIIFTDNEGNTIETPMNTVHELWNAMEVYGSHELDKK